MGSQFFEPLREIKDGLKKQRIWEIQVNIYLPVFNWQKENINSFWFGS